MSNVLGILGVLLVICADGWYRTHNAQKLAESRAEQYQVKLEAVAEQAEKTEKSLADYRTKEQEVVYVDKIITKNVVEYRDKIISRCTLSPEWVRIHNDATKPPTSPSSGGVYGTSSGVDDAQALDTVTQNYRLCVGELERFKGLQNWLRVQGLSK